MVLPTRSALSPLGLASVLPHTEQEISDEARLKMIVSLPQSLQLTFRKLDFDMLQSPIHEFELLCPLCRGLVRLPGLGAPVE